MALATHEFINGLFSLIFVSVSVLVSLIIASKYFKYRDRNLLLVGFSWLIICEPWWPVSISFLLVLLTGEGLAQDIYLLIGFILLPIGLETWLIAFTNMKYKEKQKTILAIFTIPGVLYYFLFFYFFFTDISIIGVLQGPVDVKYGIFVVGIAFYILIVLLITGLIFARESLKSDNLEIRLKGKFLIAAFISFVIGTTLSIFSSYSIFILIIGRILTISASIEFYCGFTLPNWTKKLFLKQE